MAQKTLIGNPEFDKNPEREPNRIEVEKKLQPLFPDQYAEYRAASYPIEQVYLSHPSEPYSLRLRETTINDKTHYSAALKDRGTKTIGGLRRMEISTPISEATYQYYREQEAFPFLRKLRTDITRGVSIDWFDGDETPLVEVEDSENNLNSWRFLRDHKSTLIDVTGDTVSDNERRAHIAYRREHGGAMSLEQEDSLDAEHIVAEIVRRFQQSRHVTITISGRSGSGKSTIVRDVREKISSLYPGLDVTCLSTDDYHRGKTWLESSQGGKAWNNWDAPIVYDVHSLALDLYDIRRGKAIEGRTFDFASQEPATAGLLQPTPIVIVEGIYAASPILESLRDAHFQIPTGLATCIGRRLERDVRDGRLNSSMGTPEEILRYQLEIAEPAFRAQVTKPEA